MSAIASYYLMPVSSLEGLVANAEVIISRRFLQKKVVDNYWKYLEDNAENLAGPESPGYIYGNLLEFLSEKRKINLMSNKYDAIVTELVKKRNTSHFIFTHSQKEIYLDSLLPDLFSLEEVRMFNEAFSDDGDDETAKLTIEALELLHNNLTLIKDENEVLMLAVG